MSRVIAPPRTVGSGTYGSDAAEDACIGNKANDGTPFIGRIAVTLLWNRALTLGELIDQQYNPHATSGCVGYWWLHGTGTQPDLSGNANTGTVTGCAVADHVPLRPPFGTDVEFTATPPAAATQFSRALLLLGVGA